MNVARVAAILRQLADELEAAPEHEQPAPAPTTQPPQMSDDERELLAMGVQLRSAGGRR